MHTSPLNDMYVTFVEPSSRTSEDRHGLMEYVEDGIAMPEAQRWFSAGITPAEALHFRRMDMSLEDAQAWGLRPDLVERFRALRFTRTEARKWSLAPIWPDHAVIWRHAGYAPSEAAELIAPCRTPAEALAWTLVVSTPSRAIDLKREGVGPKELLGWTARAAGSSLAISRARIVVPSDEPADK